MAFRQLILLGHSIQTKPATTARVRIAHFFDILVWILGGIVWWLVKQPLTIPPLMLIFVWILGAILLVQVQVRALNGTIGEKLFYIRSEPVNDLDNLWPKFWGYRNYFEPNNPHLLHKLSGFMALLIIALNVGLMAHHLVGHPLFSSYPLAVILEGADAATLEETTITNEDGQTITPIMNLDLVAENQKLNPKNNSSIDNSIYPLFYILGEWPTEFEGHPVVYRLPYESGPPKHFVPEVSAYWKFPDVIWKAEGPKTPEGIGSAQRVKNCFLENVSSRWSCLMVREKALRRHLAELRSWNAKEIKTQWWVVRNPQVDAQDQIQGIYLQAMHTSHLKIQDRLILIHPLGIHQAFILERATDSHGVKAFNQFKENLQTWSYFPTLQLSRMWITEHLQDLLGNLNQQGQPHQDPRKLLQLQALHLSRISVDPSRANNYLDLAKSSIQLLQNLPAHWQAEDDLRLNAYSAYRYSRDLKLHPKQRQAFDQLRQAFDRL